MTVSINKGRVCGSTAAPPSKSFAHRLILGAALSRGDTKINGVSGSEDMLATLDCIAALGADFTREGESVIISQVKPKRNSIFPCRDSGSTLRFFIPIACVLCGGGVFIGSERLIERGIGIYEEIFSRCGIGVQKTATQIKIDGSLTAGNYTLRGDISSQFITGLLFALSLLENDSTITVLPPFESRKYVDITVDCMQKFGVFVEKEGELVYKIRGGQKYRAQELSCEGDWSNAAFLYALSLLCGEVTVTGLNQSSLQSDRCCLEYFEKLKAKNGVLDISDCPDLGPILFAVAAALGEGHFVGTRRLKIKESDRAAVMAKELSKLGADVRLNENSADIYCKQLLAPSAPLYGHNDHRIVMSLCVLLLLTSGKIEGAEAVKKSYPEFFEVLKSLGAEVHYDT